MKVKLPSGLDKGIENEVRILMENGIETTESCEGGQGHPYPEPTVKFCGVIGEGFRAVAIALQNGLTPTSLRKSWAINPQGELVGPEWEITFYHHDKPKAVEKPNGTYTWEWR